VLMQEFLHSTFNSHIKLCGEGSTILLGCRTMLGECCLAAVQPKGFWTQLRVRERERVCVCVYVCVCVCKGEYENITPDNEDKTVYQELYSELLSYY
jgi:hypothetical protein